TVVELFTPLVRKRISVVVCVREKLIEGSFPFCEQLLEGEVHRDLQRILVFFWILDDSLLLTQLARDFRRGVFLPPHFDQILHTSTGFFGMRGIHWLKRLERLAIIRTWAGERTSRGPAPREETECQGDGDAEPKEDSLAHSNSPRASQRTSRRKASCCRSHSI